MTTPSRLKAEKAVGAYTRRHSRKLWTALLGNNAGTVIHTRGESWVYIRLHGDPNQVVAAYNGAKVATAQANIEVAVERVTLAGKVYYNIVELASAVFSDSDWASTVTEHAPQHQRRDLGEGGFDPLDVYTRALVNLRARAQIPAALTLYVERGFYFLSGVLHEWLGGNSPAFTIPAGGVFGGARRCDLLYMGTDDALHIVQGAPTTDGSLPPYPVTPADCIPIAYVYLDSAMTSISELYIKDARVILTASNAAAASHNLLSATHPDVVAAAPVAGDIIYGNATPKWTKLAIGDEGDALMVSGGLPAWGPVGIISQDLSNVSNPPTEAELITALGTPDDNAGTITILNDNAGGTMEYLIASDGGHYLILPAARATLGTPTVTVVTTATIVPTVGGLWYGRASVEKLSNGNLVLCYKSGTHHAVNDGALHIRFSNDQGATWTAEDTKLGGGAVTGFPMNPTGAGAGEDAGEPWLMIAPNGDLLLHMWRADYGVTANGTYQSRSTDGGASWSASAQINFVGIADDAKVFATDDHFVLGTVIYAGARVYLDVTGDPCHNILIKSTDNGTTWEYVSDITNDANNTWEVGIEYLGNNTILAMLRDVSMTASHKRVSTDLGATWGAYTDVTGTVGVAARQRVKTRAHLKGLSNWWNDSVLIMCGFIHTNPGNSQPRRNAVWISLDRGTTWTGPNYVDVETEDAGYGDLFWDETNSQFVFVSYQGLLAEASIKQYNFTVAGV